MLYYARMDSISIRSAAIKLTDKILGYNSDELPDILKEIASEFGLFHVAHMRLSADKSSDTSVLTAVVTFPKEWQARYFLKQYITVDPVIRHARNAVLPYDWETLVDEYPDSVEFFADAGRHNIGSNGLSIPVRSLKNAYSVISFTSGLPKLEWEAFKKDNMVNSRAPGRSYRLRSEHQLETSPACRSSEQEGGAMLDLGGERQVASGNRRDHGHECGQREDASR